MGKQTSPANKTMTNLIHNNFCKVTVTIDGTGYTFRGRYDAKLNAIRNLKKPSLYCTLDDTTQVLGQWKTKTEMSIN